MIIHPTLGVTVNRGTGFNRNHQNSVLELPKFLDFDCISINTSKIVNFLSFPFPIDTDERSLHEKLVFNEIYTDSVICNDPRHKN